MRTIAVNAGHTYSFGAYYGSVAGEWKGKTANYYIEYTCFA